MNQRFENGLEIGGQMVFKYVWKITALQPIMGIGRILWGWEEILRVGIFGWCRRHGSMMQKGVMYRNGLIGCEGMAQMMRKCYFILGIFWRIGGL